MKQVGRGGRGGWRAIIKKRQPGTLCIMGARPLLFKVVMVEGGGGGGQPKMFTFILLKKFCLLKFPGMQYPHQYQEWKGDVPHKKYDLPLQHSVMEYDHTGVGTIVQSTTMYTTTHLILNVHINTRSGKEMFHTRSMTFPCSKV